MINLDFSTVINRPVKDVFSFVSNPNNMTKWNSAVVSIQQVTPGQLTWHKSKQLAKRWDAA